MRVIGLCGYARVGKDTAYIEVNRLLSKLKNYSNYFQRIAFADELKDDLKICIEELLQRNLIDLSNDEWKEKFRPMWVTWGAVARKFDPLFWVKRASVKIINSQFSNIIITDVRYANEIKYLIEEMNARVYMIERPGFYPANEEEERSFFEIFRLYPKIKYNSIVNDGTKEELGEKVLNRILCDFPSFKTEICGKNKHK